MESSKTGTQGGLRVTASAGQRIKALRLQAELSQEQLAIKAGVARYTIFRIEKGKTTASELTLQRIARALDTTVVVLLDGAAS